MFSGGREKVHWERMGQVGNLLPCHRVLTYQNFPTIIKSKTLQKCNWRVRTNYEINRGLIFDNFENRADYIQWTLDSRNMQQWKTPIEASCIYNTREKNFLQLLLLKVCDSFWFGQSKKTWKCILVCTSFLCFYWEDKRQPNKILFMWGKFNSLHVNN